MKKQTYTMKYRVENFIRYSLKDKGELTAREIYNLWLDEIGGRAPPVKSFIRRCMGMKDVEKTGEKRNNKIVWRIKNA